MARATNPNPESRHARNASGKASASSSFGIALVAVIVAVGATLYVALNAGIPRLSSPSSGTVAEHTDVDLLIPEPAQVQLTADVYKREAIKDAMRYAWGEYEKYAFGHDVYHPISKHGTNITSAGGIGYTIVDAIDSLMIMGLDDEVDRARNWIRDHLSFNRNATYNTFEVTIRMLGGLLSAYHISPTVPSSSPSGQFDDLYLQKAIDLGDRLLGAFISPIKLPYPDINLADSKGVISKDNNGLLSTAEIATLQLELKYLSHLTDDDKYWDAAEHVMEVIRGQLTRLSSPLPPVFIRADNGRFVPSYIRVGSRGDSYYEYLLKQYLQTSEPVYREMYDEAASSIDKHLIQRTPANGIMHTIEVIPQKSGADGRSLAWRKYPKQDHLVCFIGGLFLLGATEGKGPIPPNVTSFSQSELRDWRNGIGMINGCMETHNTSTGLSPEIAHFRTKNDSHLVREPAPSDWYITAAKSGEDQSYDAKYMLRPETVESLFVAHRLTGHPKYREWGWGIFQAIEKHSKLPEGGYATVLDVNKVPAKHEDRMETFFLSETLKYLYLLFDDNERFSPRDVVFNTEAHIFPKITL